VLSRPATLIIIMRPTCCATLADGRAVSAAYDALQVSGLLCFSVEALADAAVGSAYAGAIMAV